MKQSATGAVVIDDRYCPLIVSTFIGAVELALGQWFEQENVRLIQRERARGHRLIHVHDTTYIERTPPEMRKFWAEMGARNEAMAQQCVIETPLVVSSALMRGVLTAVGWLNPKIAKIPSYATIDQAIVASVAKLEAEKIRVTLPFKKYALPPEAAQILPPLKASG